MLKRNDNTKLFLIFNKFRFGAPNEDATVFIGILEAYFPVISITSADQNYYTVLT